MRRLLVQVALALIFALTLATPALADTITVTVATRGGQATCTATFQDVNGNGQVDEGDVLLSYSCSNPGRSTP